MSDRIEVTVHCRDADLRGDLALPEQARGLVIFAHGSGSSRHSPRNQQVAAVLQRAGLATLLFDLLTPEEDAIDRGGGRLRFDIELLARRLVGALDWAVAQPALAQLPIGLFGASTGAAAALVAAAARPALVRVVVSRGGRPDLAGAALRRVRAPTLLLVGGDDTQVLALNAGAAEQLDDCQLSVVPGATHLFEEPGALAMVAEQARDFLVEQLQAGARRDSSTLTP